MGGGDEEDANSFLKEFGVICNFNIFNLKNEIL
jgi:hypothetical protein